MKYRFRTLLLLIALIACVLAVFMPYYRRYRALREIVDLGAAVYFENGKGLYQQEPSWLDPFSRVRLIQVSKQCGDYDLQNVFGQLAEVRKIDFYAHGMSTQTAAAIGRLPRLEEFETWPSPCMDVGDLEAICESPRLRTITLLFRLEQGHFEVLGRNKSLTKIHVHYTYVTDKNVRQLSERPRLDGVSLCFSKGFASHESIEKLLEPSQCHPDVPL